jgi:hypothetical protein
VKTVLTEPGQNGELFFFRVPEDPDFKHLYETQLACNGKQVISPAVFVTGGVLCLNRTSATCFDYQMLFPYVRNCLRSHSIYTVPLKPTGQQMYPPSLQKPHLIHVSYVFRMILTINSHQHSPTGHSNQSKMCSHWGTSRNEMYEGNWISYKSKLRPTFFN